MSDIHFRLYELKDFAELYAIEELCFQPPFRFARRYMQRLVSATDGATWIAEKNGEMAGFAIVEWTSHKGISSAYIATIEVAPQFRGLGIGCDLLQHLEDSAVDAGCGAIWLHVDTQNAIAIRLYERCGYTFFGKEEHFYAPERGALIYRKSLAEDARK